MGRFRVVRNLAAASVLILPLFVSPAVAQSSLPAGFYVRGDAGGAFEQNITFKDTNPNAPNCDLCGDVFPSSTGNSVFLGAGVGYRLTPSFRADLTFDYLTPVKVNGQSTGAAPSTASADFDSAIALVNGYFDLAGAFPDSFGPFQPFVSVGIGVARNHLGTTTGVSTLIGSFTLEAHSRMNFAWAIGAGVGYVLTPRLTMELAYKYVDTGQVRNGATLTAGGASFELTPSKTGDLGVHAVTVGLRYGF